LIQGAAIRAQISQIEKYQTAVTTFRVKFNALPGDMNKVTAAAFGFTARGNFAGQGDGNGLLEGVNSNAAGFNNGLNVFGGETEMFWVDLTTAKMVDGGFSTNNMLLSPAAGVAATVVYKYFPAAKIGNGNYIYVWSGGWQIFSGPPGNSVNYFGLSAVLAGPAAWNGAMTSNVSLTVRQAYNIDQKIDDGLPMTGNVMAMYPSIMALWPAGGAADPIQGAINYGDHDGDTGAPITPQTVNPYYATDNGVTLAQTCYNNGHTLVAEHYSMEVNQGAGPNCALSFKFQ
jgi:hypothetical protein